MYEVYINNCERTFTVEREREREVLNFRITNYIEFQNKKIDQVVNYYLIICGHNSNKLIINHSVCVHSIIN